MKYFILVDVQEGESHNDAMERCLAEDGLSMEQLGSALFLGAGSSGEQHYYNGTQPGDRLIGEEAINELIRFIQARPDNSVSNTIMTRFAEENGDEQ